MADHKLTRIRFWEKSSYWLHPKTKEHIQTILSFLGLDFKQNKKKRWYSIKQLSNLTGVNRGQVLIACIILIAREKHPIRMKCNRFYKKKQVMVTNQVRLV